MQDIPKNTNLGGALPEALDSDDGRRLGREQLLALAEAIPIGMWSCDPAGVAVFRNEQCAEISGRDEGTSADLPWQERVHPDDRARVAASFGRFVAADDAWHEECRYVRPDGEIRWVQLDGRKVVGADGAAQGLVGTTQDITELTRSREALGRSKERAEELLRDSDRRSAEWHALAATVPTALWSGTPDGALTAMTDRWHDFTGQPEAEALGDGWQDRVHPGDLARVVEAWRACVADEGHCEQEFRVVHVDTGVVRTLLDRAQVARAADGRVIALVGASQDVTDRVRAETEVRHGAAEMEALMRALPSAIWKTAADGSIVFCSERWHAITGQTAADMVGYGWDRIVHPDDQAANLAAWELFIAGSGAWESEYRIIRPDGEVRWLHDYALPVFGDDGAVAYHVGTTLDVTDRRLAEQRTANRAEQQAAVAQLGRLALDSSTTVAQLLTQAATIVSALLDLELASVAELVDDGEHLAIRATTGAGGDDACVALADYPRFRDALTAREPVLLPDESPAARAGGGLLDLATDTVATIALRDGAYGALWARPAAERPLSTEDVTFLVAVAHVLASAIERSRDEAAIRHQALYDSLTGLANRTLLLDRLDHAIERCWEGEHLLALLFVDLDNFKYVNDSLGHAAGDELLVAVTRRLVNMLRPGDTAARLGGDEFVVVCEDLPDPRFALTIGDRLRETLGRPFVIGTDEVFVTASIGVVVPTHPGETATTLLQDADTALYRAKGSGRDRCEAFDRTMQEEVTARLRLDTALRRGIEREEFVLHYQPIISLADGKLRGFEALVRWRHPERGLVPPDVFIPLAEETGVIVPLGRWVLGEACRQLAAWSAQPGGSQLEMSVNVSSRQIADSSLVPTVRALLKTYDLAPHRLGIELTETALMEQTERAEQVLAQLKATGVRLLLDDFGTGYSSLSYLQDYPIDALKLDRSFVSGIGRPGKAHTPIVRAITGMAAALGLPVVAEGVETASQLAAMRACGCQYAQGYHFARPLSAADATAFLRAAATLPVAA